MNMSVLRLFCAVVIACSCFLPGGCGQGPISPSWSASSEWDGTATADRADFNTVETSDRAGAWVAGFQDQNQWLMRDLGSVNVVTGIITKGRNYNPDWPCGESCDQYVTSYVISYGIENGDEQFYTDANNEAIVGVNVALGKTAFQTSTDIVWRGEARLAVDGNTDTHWHHGSCTHTVYYPGEANPAWWVDLGQSYVVGRVVILNRQDAVPERLNPFNIHIGDSGPDSDQVRTNPKCGGDHLVDVTQPSISVSCQGMRGRYVAVRLPGRSRILTLCEVLIFPAVDPTTDLTVTDVTDEGFRVTWSPSPDPDLQGYRVVVSEMDMVTAVNQSTNQTWLQVAGLTLETDYVISVRVLVLSDGRLSQSNATAVEATTRMSSSTDLEFVDVTETTSMLGFTWVPPDAVVTGYRVMYGQEEATEQLSPSPGPADRSAVIEGLQPDTMYNVQIITIGLRRESLPLIGRNATEPDECATVNGRCDHICSNIPGGYKCLCRNGFVLMTDAHGCGAVGPPMDLAVTDITDEGFKVTWSPSPDPDLEGYRVVVSGLDMVTAVNQSTAEASLPVIGLSPEADYVIRVTALFSSGGWRSQSEAAMIVAETGRENLLC
uniref:Uncharacterized protein n=1 Tax=Branchiostoma floridae TaxID=7739 RepID=C3YF42_BRAFL|eukprot:XP_002605034.1 hypothetical protein BRAFLDRAFT_85177 [Branchiostoma floridae]